MIHGHCHNGVEKYLPIILVAIGYRVEGIVRERILVVAIPRNFKGFLDIMGPGMIGLGTLNCSFGRHSQSCASQLQEEN
jgi:hypothetical protein